MGLPDNMATSKLKARGKGVIPIKQPKYEGYEPMASRPEVKIVKCIGFQKFRYCGENRPGKKYQDKDFLQLALVHLSGKNVKVQIVCFDAEQKDEIHPNGLVGRDCIHGVYTKTYPVSKGTQIVRIPYLRTERILTKKTGKEGKNQTVPNVFQQRSEILPSPYKEKCIDQSRENKKYDTTRVCFGIICTIEGEQHPPIFCQSNVVQNASEKTMLKIHKLSSDYISAQEGGTVDIFTTDDGPPLTAGKCRVHIHAQWGEHSWDSEPVYPPHEMILYKRVVTFRIPAFAPNPAISASLKANIVLSCMQSGQACSYEFFYEPGADSAKRLATMHSNKPPRKRPYIPSPDDNNTSVNGNDLDIKTRMKEKLNKSRQSTDAEPQATYIPATVNVAVPQYTTTSVPAQIISVPQNGGLPLHEQDDLVIAQDMQTGEIVYIRAQDSVAILQDTPGLPSSGSLNSLTLLSDTPRAVMVPASEWSASSTPTSSTSASVIRSVESTTAVQKAATGSSSQRRSRPIVSPWIVDEPKTTTPLMNGDISFTAPRTIVVTAANEPQFKQEPADNGPPILTSKEFNEALAQGVTFSLPSNALLSNTNLPSITGLFSNSILEDQGLLSASVFEMVQPYIDKADK